MPFKILTEYYYFVIDELVDVVLPLNVYFLVPISIARFVHEFQHPRKCLLWKRERKPISGQHK